MTENPMTKSELAKFLGVHRVTVWKWLKDKKIKPKYKVGRKMYFVPSQFEVQND